MPAKNDENYENLRHSCAHLLAGAVISLWPKAKPTLGPPIEDGFYYDFDFSSEGSKQVIKISEEDLPKIEKRMHQIIKDWDNFERIELGKNEAIKQFSNNEYKKELIKEHTGKGEKITLYKSGTFIDLCKGGHVDSPKDKLKHFKLLSVAGAYWRGDEKNKMLTRIYGTVFFSQKELKDHLQMLEEAKKRDHRVLGQKLELFIFDEEVGQGLPLWLPKGAFVRHKIMEFAFNTYLESGYQPIVGPHIASEALWKHSGHLDFYKESMYSSFGIDQDQYRLKPMNCPIHVKMYNSRPRSYKELPLRWTEMGTVYRYEKSGVLHGLTRVRGFTQDDAHIICRPDQLHNELVEALKLTLYILRTFDFTDFEMNLSVRDPKNKSKFAGSDKGWVMAEKALIKALKAIGYKDYILDVGGAVFYGPKIDVKVADSIGRKWQLSTIQFDFNLPGRFKMKYIEKDGTEQEPFMIHRALLGSLERFMGVYIEHTAGAFPVWLAPVQVKVLPITERNLEYAQKVAGDIEKQGIRVETDDRSETLQAKIRDAQLEKIPYMLVVGDKEASGPDSLRPGGEKTVSLRLRSREDLGQMSLDKFIKTAKDKIDKKALDL